MPWDNGAAALNAVRDEIRLGIAAMFRDLAAQCRARGAHFDADSWDRAAQMAEAYCPSRS